jgi:hypothetical protein
MGVITIIGCGIAVVVSLLIHHRTSALCQVAKAATDQQVHENLKRAKAIDASLAQEVLGGADIDPSIEDFARKRSGIFSVPTETPWLWDSDHLKKWAGNELAAHVSALNRKARLMALSALVGIILAVLAIDAVLYGQLANSSPALSPQPPARFQPIPTPHAAGSVNPNTAPTTSTP